MRSYTVGRITGIPIRINITLLLFLPLLAWLISNETQLLLYADLVEGISPHTIDTDALTAGSMPLVIGIAGAIGLFVGVLLHELGHSWTAMRYDIPIASITLWIFGGLARMEELPEDWNVEFWIALAGPVTSVLVGVACYAALFVVPPSPVLVFLLGWLAMINVVLAVFNMLPAFPMDGGRILRALLARSRPYGEATSIAASIGRAMALAMAAFGLIAFAPLLILVAMFVYVAAGAESRAMVLRDLLRDVTVAELAREDDGAVRSTATVDELLDRMFAERRTGYPVVDPNGNLSGIVSFQRLRTVPVEERSTTTVDDIMTASPPTLSPDDPAIEALEALSTGAVDRIVIVDDGRVVGTVTNEDVGRYLELIQGIGPTGRRDPAPPDGYA